MKRKKQIINIHLEQKKTQSGITWFLRYQDIDGKRYRIAGSEKKGKAQALLSKMYNELNSDEAVEARNRGCTYNQFKAEQEQNRHKMLLERKTIEEFLISRIENAKIEKANSTVKAYEITNRYFLEYIRHYNRENKLNISYLEDITVSLLEGFQIYLKSKYGFEPATIKVRMNILQGHLSRAQKLGYILKSPGTKLDQVKIPDKEVVTYSDVELKRLLNVVKSKDPRWFLYILVALDSGCRPMELQQLVKKKHIKFYKSGNVEFGTILIESQDNMRTKTKNSRFVPLKDHTVKLLKPYLLSFGDDDVVFKDIDKSKGRKYAQFLKLAGIPVSKSIYTLRRTCLSKLANQKLSPLQLMKVAGHKSINTSLKYYLAFDSIEISREIALYEQNRKHGDGSEITDNTVRDAKAVYACG